MEKRYGEVRILTPGPTAIPPWVKAALVRETTNPDLDPQFFQIYREAVDMLRPLTGAWRGRIYVWAGEAILGLEAAVANSVKKGAKTLVIDNGVYGQGFGDLVRAYGGVPVQLGLDWRQGADPAVVDRALEREKDVEVVTMVHCDTPSAIYNDLREVAKVVKSRGALLIVDAVSSIGGAEIKFDQWGIDVLIGGSQKALNAPPGLTIMAVSDAALEKAREVGFKGYYMSYFAWEEWLEKGGFPYTMPDVLIYALWESLKKIHEEGLESVFQRHARSRLAVRRALESMGLEIYPKSLECTCPTVTAFRPPVDPERLREHLWRKYGVLIAGSWGPLRGILARIGHMGIQASLDYIATAITALASGLRDFGIEAKVDRAVEEVIEAFR